MEWTREGQAFVKRVQWKISLMLGNERGEEKQKLQERDRFGEEKGRWRAVMKGHAGVASSLGHFNDG